MRHAPWLGGMVLLACNARYDGLAVRADAEVQPGDRIDDDGFRLGQGHALRVYARPRSDRAQGFDDPDAVELRSADAHLLRVFRDQEAWRWVLVGRNPGHTCLNVVLDGRTQECIPAVVVAEERP